MSDVADESPINLKQEPSNKEEPSLSESASSPEPDLDGSAALVAERSPRRKGGRKPIYATSEERKQRNRQAQAAFRERRTEYIKELEKTIDDQTKELQRQRESQQSIGNEVLMLRYKNTLLERICFEKGINVPAEITSAAADVKSSASPRGTVSAALRPQHEPSSQKARVHQFMPPNTPLSGHKRKRVSSADDSLVSSRSRSFPIIEPGPLKHQQPGHFPFLDSTSNGSAGSNNAFVAPHFPPLPSYDTATTSMSSAHAPAPQSNDADFSVKAKAITLPRPSHWPSPYKSHNQELEQEYEAHVDDLEEHQSEHQAIGPGPYPQVYQENFFPDQAAWQHNVSSHAGHDSDMNGTGPPAALAHNGIAHSHADHVFHFPDPGVESDIFGLTASMHFETPYTLEEKTRK